jgi:hypothetical protein
MSVEFACGGTGVAKGRIRQVLDPPGPGEATSCQRLKSRSRTLIPDLP